jgi:hypothetical protein
LKFHTNDTASSVRAHVSKGGTSVSVLEMMVTGSGRAGSAEILRFGTTKVIGVDGQEKTVAVLFSSSLHFDVSIMVPSRKKRCLHRQAFHSLPW